MYNINKEIESEIIDAITPIIDEYLQGRTVGTGHAKNVMSKSDYDSYFDGKKKTLSDAKKDFNKNSNISKLIKDIKHTGFRNFSKMIGGDSEEINLVEYKNLVKKLVNEVIRDKIAKEKDKKLMENVKNFDKYFENQMQKLYEIKLPTIRMEEILDDVTQVTNDTLKKVLVSYYKTYDDYIDLTDKKKHLFKVNDMVGDIMNNNRVSFDVCIFDKQDIDRIKTNLIDFSIGEFYASLPSSLNIFGIDMKPASFINKEELKAVFDGVFVPQEIVDVITGILNYKFDGQFNDFFIWSNKK